MKIKPLADRVVVKMTEAEEKTQSGIILDGKEVEMYVKVGDKVITGKYAGTEVKLDKEEYIIVRQSDILAIVE